VVITVDCSSQMLPSRLAAARCRRLGLQRASAVVHTLVSVAGVQSHALARNRAQCHLATCAVILESRRWHSTGRGGSEGLGAAKEQTGRSAASMPPAPELRCKQRDHEHTDDCYVGGRRPENEPSPDKEAPISATTHTPSPQQPPPATTKKTLPKAPTATMKDAFNFLVPHIWPKGRRDHKMRIITLLSFAFGSKIFFVAVPFYFKSIIDTLVNAGKDGGGGAGAVVKDLSESAVEAAASEDSAAVQLAASTAEAVFGTGAVALVMAYGVTRVAASLMSESRMALFTRVGADAYKNITESLLLKVLNFELGYHITRKTGEITKVLDRGSRAFSSMAWCILFVFIPTGFEMGLVCLLLQKQVGIQFVVIAVSAVVTYVGWTTTVTNWRAKFRDAYNDQETKCSSMVVDSLLNYETIKYFRSEKFEAQRLRQANNTLTKNLIMLDQSMCGLNFGQQFIFITAATTSLYFASHGVMMGTMSVGDLVLVDALLLQLYTPLSWLGVVYREMTTATQDMRAMLDLLNRPTLMIDAPDVKPFEHRNGTIELRNASFAYGEKQVLNNVSLTIPGGSLVAFVGPSGTGKTTIFRLLFRFFELDSGQILVDGQEVRSVSMDSLRSHIGVVPQDTVMFNDTAAFNILYGRRDASFADVQRVAQQASVHDAISRLEHGYDTMVGERGLKLSGGEKQRLAIARVLLQDPDIVLADEATSALDTQTESEVISTLRGRAEGRKRTVIMIAHRLATVRNCDIIFVLGRNGTIVERGSHDELLAQRGMYHSLWTQQLTRSSTVLGSSSSPPLATHTEEKQQ
jgi:ABC-type transport system involved in Fe-S cluster assembly fused permease/ATPase subunit